MGLLVEETDSEGDVVFPAADEIRAAMADIDRQIFEHVGWLDKLNMALVCKLPFDPENFRENAHHCCPFGRWYDNESPDWLRDVPGYEELGQSHRRMHQGAHGLLRHSAEGRSIEKAEYDAFLKLVGDLRLHILLLKRTLEDMLFDFDPLTGAGNRVGMMAKLHKQQQLVDRQLVDCMLVMMDLDEFKQVNDSYGHTAGDRALMSFARYIMDSTRPFDMLFRYGGEEFLLCAPQSGRDMALETVERIRKGLMEVPVTTGDGDPDAKAFQITASFGIAFMEKGIAAEEALRRADVAVYAAKKAGRNCTRIWLPGMGTRPNA
ncbi:diguanylate cyclase (GGDEF)-like protein [Parvibaculum indicum]|uniref:diguanylate cyclase domain-containing protein n=1 Tax=Parvibaculum indicum TaxID=562969 RepID=UPI001423960C|nr:diguanylate cyclase [Parvibaculum indicum]NIJ43052.1 diguanylate cyclase (GGDEF)-like protein [Parvibaculum indicum]